MEGKNPADQQFSSDDYYTIVEELTGCDTRLGNQNNQLKKGISPLGYTKKNT